MIQTPKKEVSTLVVYPTKKSAVGLKHPNGYDALSVEGTIWPRDVFTARRIADGSVTTEKPMSGSKTAPASSATTATTSTIPASPVAPAPTVGPAPSVAPAPVPASSTASK